ncbi:hypothetical protein EsH8_II_001073 [Colletotrichum jinshuiense]
MANWKELGEVPDSDDELDFDSQEFETAPNPDLPTKSPLEALQTTKNIRESIWDVPESSQEIPSVVPGKFGSTAYGHVVPKPCDDEPPSSPLSSVPDMDELDDPFELDKKDNLATVPPPLSKTRPMYFPNDRDDSPDPLAGDDSISTSYVKITAPHFEFPIENEVGHGSNPRSPVASPASTKSMSQPRPPSSMRRAKSGWGHEVAKQVGQDNASSPSLPGPAAVSLVPSQSRDSGGPPASQHRVSLSRVEEVASQVAVRYERSFRPRKPIQEHPYLIENAQYSKTLKSHGLRPVRMPSEPASRRQRTEEDSQEKDFEDDSPSNTADVPNETTDESQFNGLDEPQSSGLLRASSLSPSPLRTSSPKHQGGPSSQPSNEGETDNTSLSDNDDLPSLDEIHRDLLATRSAKRRRLVSGSSSRSRLAHKVTSDTRSPSRPTFRQYDDIYGVLSSPSSSLQPQPAALNLDTESVPLPEMTVPQDFLSDDEDETINEVGIMPQVESERDGSVGVDQQTFDMIVADLSDAGEDIDPEPRDMSDSEHKNDGTVLETNAGSAKNKGRAVRGVLPASWITLNQQEPRPKPTKPSKHQRHETSTGKTQRRGLAVPRINPTASTTAPAAFVSDISDDDVAPTPTPWRHALTAQTVLPFERSVTEIIDDDDNASVVEDNQIDHMLPGRKRQLTLNDFQQPAKRQKRKNNSTPNNQSKKLGRPTNAANRSSRTSRLDPWDKSRISTSSSSRLIAKAKTPPKLSILDVIEPEAPRFLKIAARTAQNRRHLGRSSPTNKTIRLASRKDNVDAGTVLQNWKGGKIRPRQQLQSKSSNARLSARHPLSQLSSNSNPRVAAFLSKSRIEAQADPHHLDDSTSSTPMPEARSKAQPFSGSHSTKSQRLHGSAKRPAQLETDVTEQPGRVGFHARKRALDALFHRSNTQSLSSRRTYLDSVMDDASSIASGCSFVRGASPEPPIAEKSRPRRPRKPTQPIHVDIAAAQFRHADDPLPTTELLTSAETPKLAFDDNQLLGLGSFGTHYTQHFEIFPLDRGVFFHETTLIGSGRIKSAVDDRFSEKLWQPRPRLSFHLGEEILRWDTWTEQVSSELGILMDGILDQIIKPALPTEAGFNAKDAARFVLDYVQKAMSFADDASAHSFVTRLSDVTQALLSRLGSGVRLDLHKSLQIVDVFSNLILVLSCAIRLCQKTPSLTAESLVMEGVLRKAAEAFVQILLEIGLDDVSHLYDDLQTLRYRERGIRSDKVVPHAWVLLMKILESLRIPRMTFWDVAYARMIQPSVMRGVDAQEFEKLWKKMFILLPLCEFDNTGVIVPDKRHQAPMEGWALPQQALKRVFELYRENPRQSPSFNDYCRTLVSRCHYLVDQWGWQKCSGIIGTIFDFFGSQNLSHLRNEEAFRSARFLDNLHLNPSLAVEAEDRCFHIFLKLVALTIKKLRRKGLVNDIRNLVARTLPNHDRQYSKEQNVHQNDLAALRNHHDLLCTLFWAAPPEVRPGIHNLEKLVIPASSHKEACLINLRAWNQLARFVVHEESAVSFTPLSNWQVNVFKQLLDQFNSAAADIQQQFLALSKDVSSNISEDLMNSIVATNKAATMEIMLFSVKSAMDVVQHAGSLELARLASSTYQLQQVFQHFSTLPADFPSTLLQASLTTLERLLGRIESVFNEADDSQDSMASNTLESEDAILMLERELAAVFFSMARCLLANQTRDKPGASAVSQACVEQSVVVSGMMTSLFVRCQMMQLSQVFKPGKYGLFEKTPNKLNWERRLYLPLFLAIVAQKGAVINIEDIEISLLQLWLLVIVQPSHCLKFENQFGQQLQRQAYPFIPDKAAGLVVNPGYLSNRGFFEHAVSWMRQSLQTSDSASKKDLRAKFEKALNAVMHQMRIDVQTMAIDPLEHPSYVKFVRNIISLIKAHGADICPVQKFFLEVSKEYSPPLQDPHLQAALIQSYGFKLAEGDSRISSTLFHFFLNNFKGALQRDRLPHEVILLKGALKHGAIMSFILGKMVPAVLHATLSSHEAYALLDVLCDALGLSLAAPTIARQVYMVAGVDGADLSNFDHYSTCGGAEDGKPPDKPASEQDDDSSNRDGNANKTESASSESAFRRSRGGAFASARARLARPRAADELPPVKLPQSFLDNGVSIYDLKNRINTLTNDLWHHRYMGAYWHDLLWKDLDLVFSHASWSDTKLQDAIRELGQGNTEAVERRNRILAEASQWFSLSIDEMQLVRRTSQNSRAPLPITEFADMLRYSNKFVLSNLMSQHTRGTMIIDPVHDQNQDRVLQSLVDQYIEKGQPKPKRDGLQLFDPRVRGEIITAVRAEFCLKPEASAAGRELKRPLTVINITNYTGRSHTKKLMKHVASCVDADLIQLDAQELGLLVGEYIGQDCAHSRGSISMLGYRAAEMNGRLGKYEEAPKPSEEDVSGEIEAAWVNLRDHGVDGGYSSPMENELQKIKEGAKDYILPSFDRWENLKINAVLEEIANSATKMTSQSDRNLLIHVDDFVELNMTLEGALLLGRLRAIVDTMWRAGKRVTLVGTSSNENPSEQYTSTLKEIMAEECLIPVTLNFQRITNSSNTKKIYEANDYFQENLRNIEHMLRAMTGATPDYKSMMRIVGVSKASPPQYLLEHDESDLEASLTPPVLATSIIPLSDVYHISRLFLVYQDRVSRYQAWKVLFDVVESSSYSIAQMHKLQYRPKRPKPSSVETPEMQKPEPERLRVSGNYNDYEKKLLSGLVNSSEIKTTFADVHADPETKNNLKLLTSLSLLRPEAFTYGVLATDRIPGCLLYGPPGTGKTLLAKAVAKESGANMLEVSGASINDMYVGQSEKNVRALFSLAKKLSPLVIFIDEADALLAARGQRNRAAHRETINQFLREWDGMSDTKAFIMVATNRPFDLDDAVLRRLPRKILVDLPLKGDRASILHILLKGEDLDSSVSIDDVARQTVLYSGSDLKNLCVAAAMTAVQEESEEAAKHTGPEPYVFPSKRTLRKHHFDKALKMIAASVSEDMDSLKSIRRFDEKYGDVRSKNSQKRKGMGFGVIPESPDAEEARVRQAVV